MGRVGDVGPFIMIGASALFVVLVIVLGFGGKETQVPLTISFASSMDATGGPAMKVWARTPHPAYIQVQIYNAFKKEDDGTIKTGIDMFELFPTGDEPNHGGGTAKFSMTLIDASEEPPLNKSIPMIPMIYRRYVKVNMILNMIFWIMSFSVGNWAFVKWSMILGMFSVLGAGIGLFALDKKKQKETLVEPIFPQ